MSTTNNGYIENFTGKFEWLSPFQRQGKFPLDRSSMFASYADALKYAKQDESDADSRGLYATSYVGQIVTVHSSTEVAAYIIGAVGAGATLYKLAQTTASGDITQELNQLSQQITQSIAGVQSQIDTLASSNSDEHTAIRNLISALENKVDNLDIDTDTQYEFSTSTTTDGAITVVSKDKSGKTLATSDVAVKGWESLANLAVGRSRAFVYQNTEDTNYLRDIQDASAYRVGDVIYFKDKNIADQWVTAKKDSADNNGVWYEFAALETEKPDLSQYLTGTQISTTYATKNELSQAVESINGEIDSQVSAVGRDLVDLSNDYNNYKTEVSTALQGKAATTVTDDLQDQIDVISEELDNLDVSSQITEAINELGVEMVGGGANAYIKSIKQVNGKIEATADTLPDIDGKISEAVDDVTDAYQTYVNTRIGEEIDESTTVHDYFDQKMSDLHYEMNQNIATNTQDITDLGKSVATLTSERIVPLETDMSTAKTNITTLQGDVGTLNTNLTGVDNRLKAIEKTVENHSTTLSELSTTIIPGLQSDINARVKTVKVNGVPLTADTNGAVDIQSISTDMLTQGTQTLVLDCLNASLVDSTPGSN